MGNKKSDMNRRQFLHKLGLGAAVMATNPLGMLAGETGRPQTSGDGNTPNQMTYRVQHRSGDKVSLLGFGMMRLPDDQDEVNRLVDYAIAHGVNYFDTAPMYKGGNSEPMTGITLSRHPREKYFVATKLSNQRETLWSREDGIKMYEQSFERLKVDYIDYYLLHSVGGGGVETLKKRFMDNGLLEFLLKEREAGRIRHLGFSYHGDVSVFDYLLDHQDEYHWDFVQIQMNYLDWRHASLNKSGWKKDADAEYLYDKLQKTGVQTVVMEPLRGGALASLNEDLVQRLAALRPDDSPARWAFRWVGSHPNILTTLSGMNQMSHMEENISTFSPLEPMTDAENKVLEEIADVMAGFPTIPCTTCSYCMPCPYGVDIPGNFAYYNEAVNQGILPLPDKQAADYMERKQQFADGLRLALPDASTWATQCVDCETCLKKCPQQIRIPNQMARIVETLRRR